MYLLMLKEKVYRKFNHAIGGSGDVYIRRNVSLTVTVFDFKCNLDLSHLYEFDYNQF